MQSNNAEPLFLVVHPSLPAAPCPTEKTQPVAPLETERLLPADQRRALRRLLCGLAGLRTE